MQQYVLCKDSCSTYLKQKGKYAMGEHTVSVWFVHSGSCRNMTMEEDPHALLIKAAHSLFALCFQV